MLDNNYTRSTVPNKSMPVGHYKLRSEAEEYWDCWCMLRMTQVKGDLLFRSLVPNQILNVLFGPVQEPFEFGPLLARSCPPRCKWPFRVLFHSFVVPQPHPLNYSWFWFWSFVCLFVCLQFSRNNILACWLHWIAQFFLCPTFYQGLGISMYYMYII